MSIFSRIKHKKFREYVDIIEWTNDTPNILIWRFPRYKAEIKNGAQLTVRKSQVAVLVSDGQYADIYQPGLYNLTTANMPILATLKRWKYDFDSPFKADIYFVNAKQFWNMHWITENPIVMHDSEFQSINIHASGLYCFQVKTNPVRFIRNIVGSNKNFTKESVTTKFQKFAISKFTEYLNISKITVFDLISNIDEFSSELTLALQNDFSNYGLNLMKFSVKNITLPEDVRKMIDKRIEKNAKKNKNNYTQSQLSDSFRSASNNPMDATSRPINSIGTSIGLTKTREMAQKMAESQDAQHVSDKSATSDDTQLKKVTPPPIPHQTMYHIAIGSLQQGPFPQSQLHKMVQQGQLTPDTLVWTMGMASWEKARSIPSLSVLFKNAPPSL